MPGLGECGPKSRPPRDPHQKRARGHARGLSFLSRRWEGFFCLNWLDTLVASSDTLLRFELLPTKFFSQKSREQALSRQIKGVFVGAVVHGRCRSVGSRSYRARVTLRVKFVASLIENFTAVKTRYWLLRYAISAGKRPVSTFRLAWCSCRIFLTIPGVLESSRHSQKSLPEWWGEAGCDVGAYRTVVAAKYVAAEGVGWSPTLIS